MSAEDATLSLILLAAGRGSRFGGPKQLAPVGPQGEPVFAVTAAQAKAAGFDRLVIVTTVELQERMRTAAEQFVDGLDVVWVLQDTFPPSRDVPWGTAHAVGVCASQIDGPSAVANGDDLYGDPSFAIAADFLRTTSVSDPHACIVTFELGNVLSPVGGVSRGICHVEADGAVTSVVETFEMRRDGDAIIDAEGARYTADTPTSMSLWAFSPGIPALLMAGFDGFLAEHGGSSKAEYQLPTELTRLADIGELRMSAVASPGPWLGITHREELEPVQAQLRTSTGWRSGLN